MYVEPKLKTILRGFLPWVESQPDNKQYIFSSGLKCPVGLYLQSWGYNPYCSDDEVEYLWKHLHQPGYALAVLAGTYYYPGVDYDAYLARQTFGALKKRLADWIVKHDGVPWKDELA